MDFGNRLAPFVELSLARLREFYRERGAVFWTFGFPVLLAVVLGLAFRSKPPELPLVGVANDAPAWLEEALEAVTLYMPRTLPSATQPRLEKEA